MAYKSFDLTDKENAVIESLENIGKELVSVEFVISRSGIGPWTTKIKYKDSAHSGVEEMDITDYSRW